MLFRAVVLALCVAGAAEATTTVTTATVAAADVCSNDEWSYLCNKDSWAGAADAVTGGKELLTAGLRRAMDHIAAETDCAATDTECIEAKEIVDAQQLQIPSVIDSKQLKQVSDASGVLHPATSGMRWLTGCVTLTAAVDNTNNEVDLPSGHGFVDNDMVVFRQATGATLSAEIVEGVGYYVTGRTDALIKLTNAIGGTAFGLSAGGGAGNIVCKATTSMEAYYAGETITVATNIAETAGSDYIDEIALVKFVDASLANGCDREPAHDIKSSATVAIATGSLATTTCTVASKDLQGRKVCQTAGGTYTAPTAVAVSFGFIGTRSKSGDAANGGTAVYTGTDSATTIVYSTTDHSDIAKTRSDTCGTAKDSCGTTLTGTAAANGGWGNVVDPATTTFRLCMTSPAISENKIFADTGLTVKARCGYVSATKYENIYDANTEWALTMAPQTGTPNTPGNGAATADHQNYYRCMCKANYYREADASDANFGKCVACGSNDDSSHMFRSVVGDGAHATTVTAGTPDNNGACAKCPAGRVDLGTMSTSTSSTVATDGEACTLNTAFSTDCQCCPQYTFRATIGGVHANDCAVCGAGKYAKFDAPASCATCEADVCVDECGANNAGTAVWGYRPDQTHTSSNVAVHTAADTLGAFTDTQAIAKCVTTCPTDKPKHDPVTKTCVAVCPWGTESATVGGVANVCQPIQCAADYRAIGASVGTSAIGGELVSIALSDITTNVACTNGGPYALTAGQIIEAAGTNTDLNTAGALFGADTAVEVYCTESTITSVVVTNGGTGHKVGNTLSFNVAGALSTAADLAGTVANGGAAFAATNGAYTYNAFTTNSGTGTGATLQITVAADDITAAGTKFTVAGSGYTVGDVLTLDATALAVEVGVTNGGDGFSYTIVAADLATANAVITLSSASLRPQVGSPVYTTEHVLTGGNHMLPNHVVTAGDCTAAATATDGMTRATFQVAVDCDTATDGDQACIDQITFATMAPGLGVGSVIRFTQAAVEACDKITALTTGTNNGNTNTGAFYTGFSYTLGEGDFTPLCEQCKNGQNTNSLRHYVFPKNTVPNAGASTYVTTGETGHGTTYANNLATVDSPSALASAWTTHTALPSANYAANVFADVPTQCTMGYCQSDDQYVDNHACVACPTGKYNRQTVPAGSSTGGVVSMLPAGVSNVIEVASIAASLIVATDKHGLATGICYRATFQDADGTAPTNLADGATVHIKMVAGDPDGFNIYTASDSDCTGTAIVVDAAQDVADGDTFTIGHGLDATTAAGAASCYTATYVDGDATAHALAGTTMANGATVYAKSAGAASFNLFSDNTCATAIASDDGASGSLKTSGNVATAPTAPAGFTAADGTYAIPATSVGTSGSGSGGAFSVTVATNAITAAIATAAGSDYTTGDTLTVSAANLNAIAGISGATADLTLTLATADISGTGEDVEAGDSFTFRVRNSMAVADNMASACLATSCADAQYLSTVAATGTSFVCTACGTGKSNSHGSLPTTYIAAAGDILTVVSLANDDEATLTAAHGMPTDGCYEAVFTDGDGTLPATTPPLESGTVVYVKELTGVSVQIYSDVGCLTTFDVTQTGESMEAGDTLTLASGARFSTGTTNQGTSGDVITLPDVHPLNLDRTEISHGQMIQLHTSVLKTDVKSNLASSFTGCTVTVSPTAALTGGVTGGAITTPVVTSANPRASGMQVKVTASATDNTIDQIQFSTPGTGYRVGDVVTVDGALIDGGGGGFTACSGRISYTLQASDFLSVQTAAKTLTAASSADNANDKVTADAVHGLLEGYCYEATFKDFDGAAITGLADAATVYVMRDSTSTTDFKVYSNAGCTTVIDLPATGESVEQYDEFQVAKKDLDNGDVFFVRYVSATTFQLEDEYGMVIDLDDVNANGQYTSWEPIMTNSAMTVVQPSARLNICRPEMCASNEFSDNDGTCTQCSAGTQLIVGATAGTQDSQDEGGSPSQSNSCERVGFCGDGTNSEYVQDVTARTCADCPAGKSNTAHGAATGRGYRRDGALTGTGAVGLASCVADKCWRLLETRNVLDAAALGGSGAVAGTLAATTAINDYTIPVGGLNTDGDGYGATVKLTTNAGGTALTAATVVLGGSGYKVGDVISATSATLQAITADDGTGSITGGGGWSYTLVAGDFVGNHAAGVGNKPEFVDAREVSEPKVVAGCAFAAASGVTGTLSVGKILTVATSGVDDTTTPDTVTATAEHGLTAGTCTRARFMTATVTGRTGDPANIANNQMVYLLAATSAVTPSTGSTVASDGDIFKKFQVFSDSDCDLPIEVDAATGNDVLATDQFVIGGVTASASKDRQVVASFTLTWDQTLTAFTAIHFSAGTGYDAGTTIFVPAAVLNAQTSISGCKEDTGGTPNGLTYTVRASDQGRYQNVDGAGGCGQCAAGEKVAVDGSDKSSTSATTCEPVETCGADKYRKDNACTACPRGTTRPARMATTVGTDETATDVCTPWTCAHDENLVNNECTPCQTGTNSWVEPVLTVQATAGDNSADSRLAASSNHGLVYDRCYGATYLDSEVTAFNDASTGTAAMAGTVYMKRYLYSEREFMLYADNACTDHIVAVDGTPGTNDVQVGEMFMGLRLPTSGAVVANELVFAADHGLPANTPVYFDRVGVANTDIPELCDMSSNLKAKARIKYTRVITVRTSTHGTPDTLTSAKGTDTSADGLHGLVGDGTPNSASAAECYKATYIDSNGVATNGIANGATVYLQRVANADATVEAVQFKVFSDPHCATQIDTNDNAVGDDNVVAGDQFVVEGHSDDSECNEIYYTLAGSTGRRLKLSRTSGGTAIDLTGGAADNVIGVVAGPTTSTDPNSPATDNKCEPIVCNDNCKVTNSQCVICDATNPLSDAKETNPGGATYYVTANDNADLTIGSDLGAGLCHPARFYQHGATAADNIPDKSLVYLMRSAATKVKPYADPSCKTTEIATNNVAVGASLVTSEYLGPFPAWVEPRTLTVASITDASTDLVHTSLPHGFADGVCYEATFANAAGADPANVADGATVYLKKVADVAYPLSLALKALTASNTPVAQPTGCTFGAGKQGNAVAIGAAGATSTNFQLSAGSPGVNGMFKLTVESTTHTVTHIQFTQGSGYRPGDTVLVTNTGLEASGTGTLDLGQTAATGTCTGTFTYTFDKNDFDAASVKEAFAVYASAAHCTAGTPAVAVTDVAASDTFTLTGSRLQNFDATQTSANALAAADRTCLWNDCSTTRAPLTASSALSATANLYSQTAADLATSTCELCNAGRKRNVVAKTLTVATIRNNGFPAADDTFQTTTAHGLTPGVCYPSVYQDSDGNAHAVGGMADGSTVYVKALDTFTCMVFSDATCASDIQLCDEGDTVLCDNDDDVIVGDTFEITSIIGSTGTATSGEADGQSVAKTGSGGFVDQAAACESEGFCRSGHWKVGLTGTTDTSGTSSTNNGNNEELGQYADLNTRDHSCTSCPVGKSMQAAGVKTLTVTSLADGNGNADTVTASATHGLTDGTCYKARYVDVSLEAGTLHSSTAYSVTPAGATSGQAPAGFAATTQAATADFVLPMDGSAPVIYSGGILASGAAITITVNGGTNAITAVKFTAGGTGYAVGQTFTCKNECLMAATSSATGTNTITAGSTANTGWVYTITNDDVRHALGGTSMEPTDSVYVKSVTGDADGFQVFSDATCNGGSLKVGAMTGTTMLSSTTPGGDFAAGDGTYRIMADLITVANGGVGASFSITVGTNAITAVTGLTPGKGYTKGSTLTVSEANLLSITGITNGGADLVLTVGTSDSMTTTNLELADENDGSTLVAQGNDVDAGDLFILDSVRGEATALNAGVAGCAANACGVHMWPKLNGECAKCAAGKFRYSTDRVAAGDGLAAVTSERGFASGVVVAVGSDADTVFNLDAEASSTDNFYNGMSITVGGNAGTVVDYDGATRQVTLSAPLTAAAAVSDAYQIDPCISTCPENHKMTNGQCVACPAGEVREAGDAMCLSAVVLTAQATGTGGSLKAAGSALQLTSIGDATITTAAAAGTAYTIPAGSITGGSGTGASFSITLGATTADAAITALTTVTAGTGYRTGDVLTVSTANLDAITGLSASSGNLVVTLTSADMATGSGIVTATKDHLLGTGCYLAQFDDASNHGTKYIADNGMVHIKKVTSDDDAFTVHTLADSDCSAPLDIFDEKDVDGAASNQAVTAADTFTIQSCSHKTGEAHHTSASTAAEFRVGADTVCRAEKCPANHFVSSNKCVRCPYGETNAAGDDASGADTTCDAAASCLPNQYVVSATVLGRTVLTCTDCPTAGTSSPALPVTKANADKGVSVCHPLVCPANHKVDTNKCVACAVGKTRPAGDDARGGNTDCEDSYCAANERVISDGSGGWVCSACPAGTQAPLGSNGRGLARDQSRHCTAVTCSLNYHVQNHACVACPAGKTNAAGDDAYLNVNTDCDHDTTHEFAATHERCQVNEKVVNHACVACGLDADGNALYAPAGADPAGADTYCTTATAVAEAHVTTAQCFATNGAADATNEELDFAADPGITANTLGYYWANGVTAVAGINEYQTYYIVAGGAGTARSLSLTSGGADVDITGGGLANNLLCTAGDLCPKDYHVASHFCKPCAAYYENAAGDDVHHQDTACTRKMCAANEYVATTADGATKVCTTCPPGTYSSPAWMGGPNTHCH